MAFQGPRGPPPSIGRHLPSGLPSPRIVRGASRRSDVHPLMLVRRHCTGDWGDLGPDDWATINAALLAGERLLSSYKAGSFTRSGSLPTLIVPRLSSCFPRSTERAPDQLACFVTAPPRGAVRLHLSCDRRPLTRLTLRPPFAGPGSFLTLSTRGAAGRKACPFGRASLRRGLAACLRSLGVFARHERPEPGKELLTHVCIASGPSRGRQHPQGL